MNEHEFRSMELDEALQRAIEDVNYVNMTPVQEQTIQHILAGKDVTAQAPTGTGKTAAYAIPLISKIDPLDDHVQMLVVCPTRELAVQSLEEIQKFAKYKEGIRSMVIYGGQSIERQILTLKKKPQIIVGTPGRIMDHQRRGTLKLQDLKYLVLDEADEMLRMGFKEDVDAILKDVKSDHQTVLFSATMPREILQISKQYQNDSIFIKIESETKHTVNIKQYYVEVKDSNKEETLRRIIDASGYQLALVFCRTKRRVDQLTTSLQSKGYNVEALHGDLKQAQRDNVMKMFKTGLVNILIATDVAARGIDVNDIEAVFNFDLTDDNEFYLHRIGRTGRALKSGVAYTFVTKREKSIIKIYEQITNTTIERLIPPTLADAKTAKVNDFLKIVAGKLEDGSYLPYVEFIKTFETELNSKGEVFYKPQEIAAAFLAEHFALTDKAESEASALAAEDDTSFNERDIKDDQVRFFINLGKKDSISKDDIAALFYEKVGMKKSEFSDIFILDSYSFVEFPRSYKEKVIENLLGIDYFGRNVFVEEAQRRARKKSSSEGGRSFHREEGSRSRSDNEERPHRSRSSFGEGRSESRGGRGSYAGGSRRSSSESGERKPRTSGFSGDGSRPRRNSSEGSGRGRSRVGNDDHKKDFESQYQKKHADEGGSRTRGTRKGE